MASKAIWGVKLPAGLTVRCRPECAERFEIGIGGGQRGEFAIDGDRLIDAPLRQCEIAALARVATEVELNGRFRRVVAFGLEENFFGGVERLGAARGVSPRYPNPGITRRATNELACESAHGWPVFLFVQNGEADGEDVGCFAVVPGNLIKLGRGFGEHAELEIALGVGESALGEHGASR